MTQCNHWGNEVTDSRKTEGGHVRRRRKCPKCGEVWSTMEVAVLKVRKNETLYHALVRQITIHSMRTVADSLESGDPYKTRIME